MSDELTGAVLVAVLIYALAHKSARKDDGEAATTMWLLDEENTDP